MFFPVAFLMPAAKRNALRQTQGAGQSLNNSTKVGICQAPPDTDNKIS